MRITRSPAKLGITRRDGVRVEVALRAASHVRSGGGGNKTAGAVASAVSKGCTWLLGDDLSRGALGSTCASERSVAGAFRRYKVGHRVAELNTRVRNDFARRAVEAHEAEEHER